jgi:hypothetical protein
MFATLGVAADPLVLLVAYRVAAAIASQAEILGGQVRCHPANNRTVLEGYP